MTSNDLGSPRLTSTDLGSPRLTSTDLDPPRRPRLTSTTAAKNRSRRSRRLLETVDDFNRAAEDSAQCEVADEIARFLFSKTNGRFVNSGSVHLMGIDWNLLELSLHPLTRGVESISFEQFTGFASVIAPEVFEVAAADQIANSDISDTRSLSASVSGTARPPEHASNENRPDPHRESGR